LIPSLARIEVCIRARSGPRPIPTTGAASPRPACCFDAAAALGLDLTQSLDGRRPLARHVDCGTRAGCRTVFIDFGYDETLRLPAHFTVRTPWPRPSA
jgi:D-glycero-D-manno-heptose 1,7-bisphosphate phosphatase